MRGNMIALAEEIINGRRLGKADKLSVLITADLKELCEGADKIRKALCGNRADLCSIVNGRGGKCSENCKFCAQSAHYHTKCEEYGFLKTDEFLAGAKAAVEQGISRYSIVTAGRTLEGDDLENAIAAYQAMHQAYPDLILCASHGLMKEEDLRRLHNAGVTMYHTNIETSEEYFSKICTTHTFQDKLTEIKRARAAGLIVCSGGIFGMGETWEDRLLMAALLAELEVASIPLNFLLPIPGTPFAHTEPLSQEEMIRITAVFRYLNPTAFLRIAAGRGRFLNGGEELFCAGANAVLTGDMLTTVGNKTAQDRDMLLRIGFEL